MGDPQDLGAAGALNPRRAARHKAIPQGQQEPIDAVFEELEGGARARRAAKKRAPRDLLTYQPHLQAVGPQQVALMGLRDDERTLAWGFWGGIALGVMMVATVLWSASKGMFSMMDLMAALLLGGLAAVVWRWGPRDTVTPQVLAQLDLERGLLSWPGAAGQLTPVTMPLAEITEIVYAMIRFPVSPNRPDARIHVFTLLVRDAHDQLLPLIEASPQKEETYEIAQALSRLTGLEISQVGEGVLGP